MAGLQGQTGFYLFLLFKLKVILWNKRLAKNDRVYRTRDYLTIAEHFKQAFLYKMEVIMLQNKVQSCHSRSIFSIRCRQFVSNKHTEILPRFECFPANTRHEDQSIQAGGFPLAATRGRWVVCSWDCFAIRTFSRVSRNVSVFRGARSSNLS